MADVHDAPTRSRNMAAIRGKDTKPEMAVRCFLHRAGLRYRLHGSKLPGKPDLVLPKYSAVVFVHGCYWHRHRGCKYAVLPKSNTSFWKNKLEGNMNRDTVNQKLLHDRGWRVFVIWECELKSDEPLHSLANAIRAVP